MFSYPQEEFDKSARSRVYYICNNRTGFGNYDRTLQAYIHNTPWKPSDDTPDNDQTVHYPGVQYSMDEFLSLVEKPAGASQSVSVTLTYLTKYKPFAEITGFFAAALRPWGYSFDINCSGAYNFIGNTDKIFTNNADLGSTEIQYHDIDISSSGFLCSSPLTLSVVSDSPAVVFAVRYKLSTGQLQYTIDWNGGDGVYYIHPKCDGVLTNVRLLGEVTIRNMYTMDFGYTNVRENFLQENVPFTGTLECYQDMPFKSLYPNGLQWSRGKYIAIQPKNGAGGAIHLQLFFENTIQ